MRYVKLFEQFLNEASKPVFAYDSIKDLPPTGCIVFKGSSDNFEFTYYWPSFVSKLKEQGYVPQDNIGGFMGDEHKDSPYYQKPTIGPKQELDLLSAAKASFKLSRTDKFDEDGSIAVGWKIDPERNYHGTQMPERRWWDFARIERRTFNEFKPLIKFDDYFKPKPRFNGLNAARRFGI
jgi:hypothetical protein